MEFYQSTSLTGVKVQTKGEYLAREVVYLFLFLRCPEVFQKRENRIFEYFSTFICLKLIDYTKKLNNFNKEIFSFFYSEKIHIVGF